MLTSLLIKNLAVIKEASIDFERGFTVLTGETGAGKSILIDALFMILGARASKDIIRTGVEYVSLEDIAVTTGKNRIYLKNKIIPRMVEQGLLERKYPDNPKHPNQQYRAKNTELKVAKLTK